LRTVGIDFSEKRRQTATEMGADLVVDPAVEGFQEQIIEFFDGRGADVVLETASVWAAIETSMEIVRDDGTVAVVARHTDSPTFNPVGHPYFNKRVNLRASIGYRPQDLRWNQMNSMKFTASMIAKGKLPIGPMMTHEFQWNELPEVYARLDQGDTDILGAVIRWR
jgi:threonine dehydrogenase-like Zn-dependent dehydrogenase